MILKLDSKWASNMPQPASVLPWMKLGLQEAHPGESISSKMIQLDLNTSMTRPKTLPGWSLTNKRTEPPRKLTWVVLLV